MSPSIHGMAHSPSSNTPSQEHSDTMKDSAFFSKIKKNLKFSWLAKDDNTSHRHVTKSGSNNKGVKESGPRTVVPKVPKPGQIQRQESERRDRLERTPLTPEERRSKRNSWNPRMTTTSLQPIQSRSETNVNDQHDRRKSVVDQQTLPTPYESAPVTPLGKQSFLPESPRQSQHQQSPTQNNELNSLERQTTAASTYDNRSLDSQSNYGGNGDGQRPYDGPREEEEPDWKWILNLSMHFRDASQREKFFVTYADTDPNTKRTIRRRITVSVDYRNAEQDSLEEALSRMKSQKDKSQRIYEAIKDALDGIKFYETTTNLKLQTENGRLNVHVTEDMHEIIHYPSTQSILHLNCQKIPESDLEFDSHLSGFVYKVYHNKEVYIKKEIPSPDTVDEFLYEINALYALRDSSNVIRFGGCVVDDKNERVKGLLISYASKGALIDVLYNERGRIPWKLRENWARQIVAGLADIHEAGYVQGDFTLSNIVIDDDDNAKIIDINRRGCPVGWEPPEITVMIDGLQRIGIYIGVKSDIFQLGMCLWGIAMECDEPEYQQRPLTLDHAPEDVPEWYKRVVAMCLDPRPQKRPYAKELLKEFPPEPVNDYEPLSPTIIDVAPVFEDGMSNPPSPSLPEPKIEFVHMNGINYEIPVPPVPSMNSEVGIPAASAIPAGEVRYGESNWNGYSNGTGVEGGVSAIASYGHGPGGNMVISEENLERYEAGIESSTSLEDEVFSAMDEIVDDVPVTGVELSQTKVNGSPKSGNGTPKRSGSSASKGNENGNGIGQGNVVLPPLDIPRGSPKLGVNGKAKGAETNNTSEPNARNHYSQEGHDLSTPSSNQSRRPKNHQTTPEHTPRPPHTDSGFADLLVDPYESPVSPKTVKPLKMVPAPHAQMNGRSNVESKTAGGKGGGGGA